MYKIQNVSKNITQKWVLWRREVRNRYIRILTYFDSSNMSQMILRQILTFTENNSHKLNALTL